MQQNSKSKKAATAGAAIVNSITNITHGSGKFMDKKVFTSKSLSQYVSSFFEKKTIKP